MLTQKFSVAMRNDFARGPFHRPAHLTAFALEWLIVERNGDFLAISDAGGLTPEQAKDINHPAPSDLQRNNTLVGTLIDMEPDTGVEVYLFSQFPIPAPVTIGRQFFPGEGYARLCAQDGKIAVSAHGRHFHIPGPTGGLANGGEPPNLTSGLNWHFDAEQRAWSGETFN
ncbi:hypothetical protein EDD52_12255 [Primorskyibacter sedentarius]|uniref:Uncharacterized protein n=1 Tax=Primorskyibacter sedentarius TaxID=745311 RepID=A0A4R3J594_9RHOB|nr:hypothetical protein [Primorskyibacter sedentarius]TCS59096.1 hypothetical protein EDD52_12255 [Primorskyibacter sedentarius]